MAIRARSKAALTLLPAAIMLSACAGMGGTSSDPFSGAEGRNEFRLVVENQNFYDATIYALMNGMRRRLGSVGSNSDGVFTVPLGAPQDMRLEISMLAGPTCVTYPIPVDPGDTVRFQIRPGPVGSDFCRR